MKHLSLLAVVLGLIVFSACTRENFEEKYGPIPTTCESPDTNYTAQISAWIAAECVDCHGPNLAQAGLDLSTYAEVAANADKIFNRITLESSDPLLMPQNGPKLDLCTIEGFQIWIDNGKPEN